MTAGCSGKFLKVNYRNELKTLQIKLYKMSFK